MFHRNKFWNNNVIIFFSVRRLVEMLGKNEDEKINQAPEEKKMTCIFYYLLVNNKLTDH